MPEILEQLAGIGQPRALFARGLGRAGQLVDDADAQGARVVLELPADAVADLKSRLRDATRDRARFDDEG